MLLYILLALFVFLIFLAASGYFFSNKVLYIPTKSRERIIEYESEFKGFDLNWFELLKKERVYIDSSFGYKLYGFFIPSKDDGQKTIVFCHGVTSSHLGSVKYARMFHNRNWNVFLYDQPRHGESEGKVTGYGYYEKYDLKTVVEYIKKRTGGNSIIGIHGESMGAAAILQYAGVEDAADFYIADCSYSSLWEQLIYLLKRDFHLPRFPFMLIADFFIKMRGKFRIKDVNPLEDVKKIANPVLFIHGDADTYVLTDMCKEMFEVKKGYKEIYLAGGAAHAHSMRVNPGKYEHIVFSFLESAGID